MYLSASLYPDSRGLQNFSSMGKVKCDGAWAWAEGRGFVSSDCLERLGLEPGQKAAHFW